MPYNVAFKLVTVSGPIMLPAAAYAFAKGMRAPWPAPPAFAIAALGMLVQDAHRLEHLRRQHREHARGRVLVRDRARARAVRARRARVHARHREAARGCPRVLHRGRGHVAHRRRDLRRRRRGAAVAGALARAARGRSRSRSARSARLLTAVWSLPLVGQQAYTQSMRYAKVFSTGSSFKRPVLDLPARTR